MNKLFLVLIGACLLAACSEQQPEAARPMMHTQSLGIDTAGLTGWFYVADSGLGTPIDSTPILTARNFKTVTIFREPSGSKELYGLNIIFDREGTEQFAIATKKATGKKLAFLLFGQMVMAPTVMAPITSGKCMVYLDEYYTLTELEQITVLLRQQHR